ncbi:OmpA family protein [Candidatus Nitrospira bockiana]
MAVRLLVILLVASLAGCVSEAIYLKSQTDLDKVRKSLTQQTAALEHLKGQTEKDRQQAAETLESLRQEKERLQNDLSVALSNASTAQHELERAKAEYEQERGRRAALESDLAKLQQPRELRDENTALRQDRDQLSAKAQAQSQQIEALEDALAREVRTREDLARQLTAAVKDKDRTAAALTEARHQVRDLEAKRRAEQEQALTARQALEEQVAQLDDERTRVHDEIEALKQERERWQTRAESWQRQVQTLQQDGAKRAKALEEATARLAELTQQREQLAASLTGLEDHARETEAALTNEQTAGKKTQQALEWQIGKLQGEHSQLQRYAADLRQERDQLLARADDVYRRLQTTEQELSTAKKTAEDAKAGLDAAVRDKEQALAEAQQARRQVQELEAGLATERTRAEALDAQAQRLTAALSKAHEDVATLQKDIGQLEAANARAEQLAMRLSERDQELGSLRKTALSDQASLSDRLATLTQQLEEASRRVAGLTSELEATTDRAILAEEERDRLSAHVAQQHAALSTAERELEALRRDHEAVRTALRRQQEAEQQERDAEHQLREAERERWAQIDEALGQTLEPEIAKGDIRVQRSDDRVTVTISERLLFDPGQVKLKPEGGKVLKRLAEVLKSIPEKAVRVEGHTDAAQKGRARALWDLTTMRATNVVRTLIDDGMDREAVSAAGFADTRPAATNETDEGRAVNRRIDLVLYPKDRPAMTTTSTAHSR